MSRIIIITGKGGVGKSSIAAAHAVASAQEGKTLLVSTDMAHNIEDIFQKPVGGDITELAENLYGLELDPDAVMREDFPDMNRSIGALFSEAGFQTNKVGDEMMFPGFDDLFSLLKIGKIYESGEFERIIVDCAPTGETLSLLKLPELLAWYMEKFFPVGKTMVRILAPISKFKYQIQLPSREGMNDIERLHQKLMQLQELFKNHQVCTVRLVSTPEKMVVEETKRNYMYMNLYGYTVDGLFINRILPEEVHNSFFEHWREIQKGYIEELESVFGTIPIGKLPWYDKEIRGKEAVEDLANDLLAYLGEKLFQIQIQEERETYVAEEGRYCLVLPVPGVKENELEVTCHGLDIDISLHNFQRRIPLPNALRGAVIDQVRIENNTICIVFDKKQESDLCES